MNIISALYYFHEINNIELYLLHLYSIMRLSIHGRQYDLAGFVHPGGNEILELSRDEPDCTALFESYHAFCDMDKIKTIMKKYEVSDSKCVQMFSFEPNGFYTFAH